MRIHRAIESKKAWATHNQSERHVEWECEREKSRIHLISSWTTREFKFTTFHFNSTYFIFHTAEMGFVGRALKTAAIDRSSVQKMQFFHWNCCHCIMHCINSIFHVWMWHRNQWKYSISTGNSVFNLFRLVHKLCNRFFPLDQ